MSTNDFNSLRNRKGQGITDLSQKFQKMGSNSYEDPRIWKPIPDKDGNYSGLIRFLPATQGEEDPVVRVYQHSFKNQANRWFIHNCPTTIGRDCPLCEMNSELYNKPGSESEVRSNRAIVTNRKRKVSYYSNILVLRDPANAENNGKVFIFRYGSQIFDIIQGAIDGKLKYTDDMGVEHARPPMDPFDMWQGGNFNIKIVKNQMELSEYKSSMFTKPGPLSSNDSEIESIWNQTYGLQEFISPDKFLSTEEFRSKLNSFLGIAAGSTADMRATDTLQGHHSGSLSGSTNTAESRRRRLEQLDTVSVGSSGDEEAPFEIPATEAKTAASPDAVAEELSRLFEGMDL